MVAINTRIEQTSDSKLNALMLEFLKEAITFIRLRDPVLLRLAMRGEQDAVGIILSRYYVGKFIPLQYEAVGKMIARAFCSNVRANIGANSLLVQYLDDGAATTPFTAMLMKLTTVYSSKVTPNVLFAVLDGLYILYTDGCSELALLVDITLDPFVRGNTEIGCSRANMAYFDHDGLVGINDADRSNIERARLSTLARLEYLRDNHFHVYDNHDKSKWPTPTDVFHRLFKTIAATPEYWAELQQKNVFVKDLEQTITNLTQAMSHSDLVRHTNVQRCDMLLAYTYLHQIRHGVATSEELVAANDCIDNIYVAHLFGELCDEDEPTSVAESFLWAHCFELPTTVPGRDAIIPRRSWTPSAGDESGM